MRLLPLSLIVTLSFAGACDNAPRATQEWTPDDHDHPSSEAVDPSRMMPVGESGADGASPRQRAVAALYQVHCAQCHGRQGRGDGPGRVPAMQLPSFASAEWQGSQDDGAMAEVITRGRGMMPAFGERIAPENIRGLVEHVRRLGPAPAPTLPDTGAEPRDALEPAPDAIP